MSSAIFFAPFLLEIRHLSIIFQKCKKKGTLNEIFCIQINITVHHNDSDTG